MIPAGGDHAAGCSFKQQVGDARVREGALQDNCGGLVGQRRGSEQRRGGEAQDGAAREHHFSLYTRLWVTIAPVSWTVIDCESTRARVVPRLAMLPEKNAGSG